MLDDDLRETARHMRHELDSRRLQVELAPSRVPEIAATGGKIRVVVERNPRWYRDFCAAHPKARSKPRRRSKPDTMIRRELTLRALDELASGQCATVYARRLLPVVEDEAARYRRLAAQAEQWLAKHAHPRAPSPIHL